MLISTYLFLFSLYSFVRVYSATKIAYKFQPPKHLTATKGKFFVHTLHSANYFPKTVKVKWEATLNNKPALPSWLRLMTSRHSEIAYLIGTPITNVSQVKIHILAKRMENFEIQQKLLVINFIEDSRYNQQTTQIFELPLNDIDIEEFVLNRKLIENMESSIRKTFRGKNVNPYIVDVRPKYLISSSNSYYRRKGIIVSIGTQFRFYPVTTLLMRNLQSNPEFCKDSSSVVMNKYFYPKFNVDWCNVDMKNVTLIDRMTNKISRKNEKYSLSTNDSSKIELPPQEVYGYSAYNFWNSVILFPAIGIICVILLLVLSIIFFGSREGQKWRDYKTSRDTLEEYVSVRESQKHLRELSVQRQLLSMSQDTSAAPTGIHSFLQPRRTMSKRFTKSSSRLRDDTIELLPVDHTPVGKQTVAEAAKQCGSSLHLYRNPIDTESDDNESSSTDNEFS